MSGPNVKNKESSKIWYLFITWTDYGAYSGLFICHGRKHFYIVCYRQDELENCTRVEEIFKILKSSS